MGYSPLGHEELDPSERLITHATVLGLMLLHVTLLQSCLSLRDPMDCSPPGSSVHRILSWTRILEWVAISYTRGSSGPRD